MLGEYSEQMSHKIEVLLPLQLLLLLLQLLIKTLLLVLPLLFCVGFKEKDKHIRIKNFSTTVNSNSFEHLINKLKKTDKKSQTAPHQQLERC